MLGGGRIVVVVISVVVVVVMGKSVVGEAASVVVATASAESASVVGTISDGDAVVAKFIVVEGTCSASNGSSGKVVRKLPFDLVVETSRISVAEFPGPPSLLQLAKATEDTAATAKNVQILQRPRDKQASCRIASEGLPPPPAEGALSGLVSSHKCHYSRHHSVCQPFPPKNFRQV